MIKKIIKGVAEFLFSGVLFVIVCVGLGFWWSVAKMAFNFGSF